MARKFSKDELRDKIDGNELDLSMSQLTKVPVRELVSFFGVQVGLHQLSTHLRSLRLSYRISQYLIKFYFLTDS